ncbi:MAG: glycosyltransferase family 2 protein, partial [Clostridia bacterium]
MISIVVPVYNVQDYLAECVKSIFAQTYRDWELLLVDDGSTDKSGELCDAYAL